MTRRPGNHDNESGRVDTDRETAETMESAGMQNSVAAAGPAALLMIPVAWALTAIKRLLRRS